MQEQTQTEEIKKEEENASSFSASVVSPAVSEGKEDRAKKRASLIYRVSIISLVVNCLLTVFKLFAGIFAHSMAMISDAVHSASDVFSTFIVILGVAIASKASDEKHPYGHERFECVAAIVLAVVLGGTGVALGYSGVKTLIKGNYGSIAVPGTLALVAAAVSIVVKEGMFWVTHIAAK
ncbi:MAG: cation diffusion facilitator family transporter, partial [Clostridiales bacterium]|nr:cation diffusion facilitator family transporter [Clostridiales bacterium]